MKRDILEFISKCLTCQQVKLEHQRLFGLLQQLPIPEWKWDMIAMDFISKLSRTTSGYSRSLSLSASYEGNSYGKGIVEQSCSRRLHLGDRGKFTELIPLFISVFM